MNALLITLIHPGDEIVVNGLLLTAVGTPEKIHDKQLLRFYEAHDCIFYGYIVAARDDGLQSGVYLYAVEQVRRRGVVIWDRTQPEPIVQLRLFEELP